MTADSAAVSEVRTLLARGADQGEALPFARIREETGIGHEDLTEVLSELREQGEVIEESPGEWRPPYGDERPRARSTPAASPVGGGEPDPALGEAVTARAPMVAGTGVLSQLGGEVVLTVAVAKALGSEALGNLVMAGVDEAAGSRPFVLRVDPGGS